MGLLLRDDERTLFEFELGSSIAISHATRNAARARDRALLLLGLTRGVFGARLPCSSSSILAGAASIILRISFVPDVVVFDPSSSFRAQGVPFAARTRGACKGRFTLFFTHSFLSSRVSNFARIAGRKNRGERGEGSRRCRVSLPLFLVSLFFLISNLAGPGHRFSVTRSNALSGFGRSLGLSRGHGCRLRIPRIVITRVRWDESEAIREREREKTGATFASSLPLASWQYLKRYSRNRDVYISRQFVAPFSSPTPL